MAASKDKISKLRVVENQESPTGYTVICGSGSGVPATIFEIRLWKMLQEAVAHIHHLREEIAKNAENTK